MNFFRRSKENKETTEETPLVHAISDDPTKISLRDQSKDVYKMVTDGPFTVHVFAFFGGIALVFSSIWDFIESFIKVNAGEILISLYTLCLGCLIIIVEGRRLSFRQALLQKIKFYLRIVDFAWGRGCIYLIAGSLQFVIDNKLNSYVGGYMMLLGGLTILSSFGAGRKLAILRHQIQNKRDLLKNFKKYDVNSNGSLETKEFALLVFDLGVDVTYHELEACFNAIDKNDDECISYDEFQEWWTKWGKEQMYRNFGFGLSEMMV
mmetsp:Transcript_35081/g.40012  ORF Transcript_35081/g.40012 Transcript_35081/m.40012 type:complete len:264 (-) Transcript_35081:118-909(-)